MSQQQRERTFEDKPAVRSKVPLLIGLMGPSGGGKTFSALRLAGGIQKVAGGDIFVVDTESKRALHYADQFTFRHIAFGAPFSPLDYLAVLEHCAKKGATTVIVDSMSHEHEGPGGVLEWHSAEIERMAKGNADKADRVNMIAWAAPKAARRRLINSVLQLDMNLILCFRSKDKLKLEKGKDPERKGWMPIAGEEYLFEMTVNFLLPPSAKGIPKWEGLTEDQGMFLKRPGQFAQLLNDPRPLDENIGEAMARWAAGTPKGSPELQALNAALVTAGHKKAADRLKWISDTLGRPVTGMGELTPDEIDLCQQALKEAA
jgi:hypothetical protein